MTKETISTALPQDGARTSWLPMAVVALAQILLSLNVNALPVSIRGIVASFDAPPTIVATAIVTYSLFVAAFVMLGAKIGAIFGSRWVFQATVVLFGAAMAIMTLSLNTTMMIVAQGIAGIAAAALVPSLVVLIAANYQGKQQAQAWASSAPPKLLPEFWRFWSPAPWAPGSAGATRSRSSSSSPPAFSCSAGG